MRLIRRPARDLLLALVVCTPTAMSGTEPELIQARLRLAPSSAQLDSWPRWPALWIVPAAVARDPVHHLAVRGFSTEFITAIAHRIASASDGPPLSSLHLEPDAEWVLGLDPAERLRWHQLLATHVGNLPSRWPLTIADEDLAEIAQLPAGAAIADLVRRAATRHPAGTLWYLHDPWILNPALDAHPQRRAVLARLLSARAVWAKVPAAGSDFETVRSHAAYWRSQGRFRAIEPILQALGAVTDRDRIDLLHLLPRLPRAVLNSFPVRLDQSPDPTRDNAFAAIGFLGAVPDTGGSDFASWLEQHCDPVAGARAFGDMVVFEDPTRTPWPFTAVYLADGVVFGRRPTLSGPWGLWTLDEIGELNPRLGAKPPRIFRPRPADPAEWVDFTPLPPPAPWLRPTRLQPLPAGPWGRLVTYDIFLTPSATLLAALPEPAREPEWRFRRFDTPTRQALLRDPSLSSPQRADLERLFNAAQATPEGLSIVRPPIDFVAALPPTWRSRAYRLLDSNSGANAYFQEIRVIHPLAPGDLPPDVADRIVPLVYPRNGRFAVGDYGLIFHLAETESTRIATLQTLARTPARIVLLERPAAAEVPGIAAYWEAGGRKDLALLLEAFAEQSAVSYLDITHLLPSLPREYMNLFVLPLQDHPMPSCYWTALNFSSAPPDPRFLVVPGTPGDEIAIVEQELRTRYRAVPRPERPGDVIAYYDRTGARAPVHVCSHVAADLVFTKNGFGYDAPWCLTRRTEVDELYHQPETGVIRYYRRLPDPSGPVSPEK